MKKYEGSQRFDEWQIWSTLETYDDGRYIYDEQWTCYAGGTSEKASGRWRREYGIIHFTTEESTVPTWPAGKEQTATEDGDKLSFPDGLTLTA